MDSKINFNRTDWSDFNVWCFRVCDIYKNPTGNVSLGSLKDERLSHGAFVAVTAGTTLVRSVMTELSNSEQVAKLEGITAKLRDISSTRNGTGFTLTSGFAAGAISKYNR